MSVLECSCCSPRNESIRNSAKGRKASLEIRNSIGEAIHCIEVYLLATTVSLERRAYGRMLALKWSVSSVT
jgi:hypothetical protein